MSISSGRYLTGHITVPGDANLIPSNIKSGVSIFGVSGTLSAGDFSFTSNVKAGPTVEASSSDRYNFLTVTIPIAMNRLIEAYIVPDYSIGDSGTESLIIIAADYNATSYSAFYQKSNSVGKGTVVSAIAGSSSMTLTIRFSSSAFSIIDTSVSPSNFGGVLYIP